MAGKWQSWEKFKARKNNEAWRGRIRYKKQVSKTAIKLSGKKLVNLNMFEMNDKNQLIETDISWKGAVEWILGHEIPAFKKFECRITVLKWAVSSYRNPTRKSFFTQGLGCLKFWVKQGRSLERSQTNVWFLCLSIF